MPQTVKELRGKPNIRTQTDNAQVQAHKFRQITEKMTAPTTNSGTQAPNETSKQSQTPPDTRDPHHTLKHPSNRPHLAHSNNRPDAQQARVRRRVRAQGDPAHIPGLNVRRKHSGSRRANQTYGHRPTNHRFRRAQAPTKHSSNHSTGHTLKDSGTPHDNQKITNPNQALKTRTQVRLQHETLPTTTKRTDRVHKLRVRGPERARSRTR